MPRLRRQCQSCESSIGSEEPSIRCENCGRSLHDEGCADYHRRFDARCGAEKWIGTFEY